MKGMEMKITNLINVEDCIVTINCKGKDKRNYTQLLYSSIFFPTVVWVSNSKTTLCVYQD